uniref:Uncharacterized protein n=1 Tax=Anolis carolinensis TaxID=28377 RepID=A0A803TKF5_ANOCA
MLEGLSRRGTYIHMWWECKYVQSFWGKVIVEIESIMKKKININPATILLSIYNTEEWKENEKNLVTMLLTARREENSPTKPQVPGNVAM